MFIRGQSLALIAIYERPVTSEFHMIIMIAQVVVVLLVARNVDKADENGVLDRRIFKQELDLLRADLKSQLDNLRDSFLAERRLQKEIGERAQEDIKNLKMAVKVCSNQMESLKEQSIKNHTDQEERLSALQSEIAERCVYPLRPENGKADVEGRFYGDKVRYTCNPGYQLIGPEDRTCSNGNWTGKKPSCQPMESCDKPTELENGQGDVTGRFHGDKVRYSCNPGYKMSGPEEMTCSNGKWTGTKPSCNPMECCNKPPHPENGKADVEGRFHGDKVRYSCNPGYSLIGAKETTCFNGNWTNMMPICHPIPQLPQLRFTEAYGWYPDRVVIEEAGAALRDWDGPDRALGTTVRTDGALTAGRHYWELAVTWSVDPGMSRSRFVASVGVRRDGSDFSAWPGYDDQSWAVWILYNPGLNQWRYEGRHDLQYMFTSEPVSHDGRSDVTNRLGLLLDTEKQTLAVVDVKNNTSLFSFSAVDVSKPLVPVVSFGDGFFHGRFRLTAIPPSRLTELVMDILYNSQQ